MIKITKSALWIGDIEIPWLPVILMLAFAVFVITMIARAKA